MVHFVENFTDGNDYSYFENRDCAFYPCHEIEHINCLFCYCPLYHIEECGGAWAVASGVKDCSLCAYPHIRENYHEIIARLSTDCEGEKTK